MCPKRWFASVVLLLLAPFAQAQPVFDIGGFHSRMTFSQALEHAGEVGMNCEQSVVSGRLRARCTNPVCPEGEKCGLPEGVGITAAGQPVSVIWLEAVDADARVKRVAFELDGDIDQAEQILRRAHGEPSSDSSLKKRSWTNAVRIQWTKGRDNLGLLKTLNTITLFTNPELPEDQSSAPATEAQVNE